MTNNADVIIIGGGIIGNATAYYLSKKGAKVIVLEKNNSIGNEGSSRNGGGVRQSGRDKRELPLAMYAVKNLWPRLSEELEIDVEYYQEGNLRLAKTEQHIKILEGLTNNAVAQGLDVRMVSGDEARNICTYLSDEIIGASWCPTDGHANPLITTLAYYRKARKLGARFITEQKVLSIEKTKGRINRVITENEVYTANQVIVAAGHQSVDLALSLGIDLPINKALLETIVTEAQPPMFYQMLGTATADFYGHQSTHGSFVFGGSTGYEDYSKDNGTPTSTSEGASSICRAIMSFFPILSDVKIIRTWAGWIDECMDHIPVISPVEEVPGLILACGFCGHGFGISPIVGTLLSEMVEGKKTSLDMKEFRYDRFRAKN